MDCVIAIFYEKKSEITLPFPTGVCEGVAMKVSDSQINLQSVFIKTAVYPGYTNGLIGIQNICTNKLPLQFYTNKLLQHYIIITLL